MIHTTVKVQRLLYIFVIVTFGKGTKKAVVYFMTAYEVNIY